MVCENEQDHFQRLVRYYEKSRFAYDFFLWGSKHFGYHPKSQTVTEKQAQILMQDLVGRKLRLQRRMRVLDAGCGQGVVSSYLARQYGCRIEGITVIPFEVEKARTLSYRRHVADLVQYHLMNYSDTTFEASSFDAIYTTETLSHSTDIKRTMREFFRILKDGGRIALFEYTLDDDDTKFSDYEMYVLGAISHVAATECVNRFETTHFGIY